MRIFQKKKANQESSRKNNKIILGKCFFQEKEGEVEASFLTNPNRLNIKCSFFNCFNKDPFKELIKKFYKIYLKKKDSLSVSSDEREIDVYQISINSEPTTFTLVKVLNPSGKLETIKDFLEGLEEKLGFKIIIPEEKLTELIRRET